MTEKEFEKIVTNRQKKTHQLLLVKGKEYRRNGDVFHNSHRAAEMNREQPVRALHGILTKHLVSYLDILDDIDAGKPVSMETIEEKMGDIMVYIHLQEALIIETLKK